MALRIFKDVVSSPLFWQVVQGLGVIAAVVVQILVVRRMTKSINRSAKDNRRALRETRRLRRDAVRPKLVFPTSHSEAFSLVKATIEDASCFHPTILAELQKKLQQNQDIFVPESPWGTVVNFGPGPAINAAVNFLTTKYGTEEVSTVWTPEEIDDFPLIPMLNWSMIAPACLRVGECAQVLSLPLFLHLLKPGDAQYVDAIACMTCEDAYGTRHRTFQKLRFIVLASAHGLRVAPVPGEQVNEKAIHGKYGWSQAGLDDHLRIPSDIIDEGIREALQRKGLLRNGMCS